MSLYHIFYVSDLPGTQESIGLGGISGEGEVTTTPTTAATPTTAPTELMVQHIIEDVVKRKIEAADRVARTNAYPIGGDGKINRVKFQVGPAATDVREGSITVQVALPTIAKETNLVNVLKLLGEKISAVLTKNAGVVRPLDEQAEINELARKFYSEHKVRVIVTFDLK